MKKKIISILICTLLITSLLTFFGTTNVSAEESPLPPFEDFGWLVEGSGTYFEITNSSYLNITLSSSENIYIRLESNPKIICYYIESNCSANSTLITLSNLEPDKTYYLYQDGDLTGAFATDQSGSYSYIHDFNECHITFIQEITSTIEIKSDGTIDPPTAPISRVGNTYTLTGNIYEPIRIYKSHIILDGAGYSIQGSSSLIGGILIWFVNNITIENVNVVGFYCGIYLCWADWCTIKDCNVSYNRYGIDLYGYVDCCTVKDNNVSNNFYGIDMYLAQQNTIMNNIISHSAIGIPIIDADQTTITNNIIVENQFGIHDSRSRFSSSEFNTISENTISNNYYGFCLTYSNYTTVTDNTISNNDWGVYLYNNHNSTIKFNTIKNNSYVGIYRLYSLGEERLHHNNIITNKKQVIIYDKRCYWDDGLGEGNYWGDYTGVDDGSNGRTAGDGIGDTLIPHPYTSGPGTGYYQLDNYPLMSPYDPNEPPIANAGGPYIVDEGTAITFDASSSSDPDGDELQYRWDFEDDGTWNTDYSSDPTATNTWNDDYSGTVVVEVYDGELTDTATAPVTVNNVAPAITSLELPVDPVQLNNAVDLTADFTDPGILDTHTATIDWGDGNTSDGSITGSDGVYTATASWTYGQAGVYTVTLTVEDDDEGSTMGTFQYVVVYDPSAGFVTGAGWIMSPEGAYTPDPDLTGMANFGFVSRYVKGKQNPLGFTGFKFRVADMNFQSSDYDWLVIAGAKAMYKGNGTINGDGNYRFMLSAIDEDLTPSTDVDLFRIKIWDKDNDDEVIYDNEMDVEEDEDPNTGIGGGNIKVHKN